MNHRCVAESRYQLGVFVDIIFPAYFWNHLNNSPMSIPELVGNEIREIQLCAKKTLKTSTNVLARLIILHTGKITISCSNLYNVNIINLASMVFKKLWHRWQVLFHLFFRNCLQTLLMLISCKNNRRVFF